MAATNTDAPNGRQDSSPVCKITNKLIKFITNHLTQGEITCLSQICRKLAASVQPIHSQRDIGDNIYNSFAWVCFFGDTALASSCLKSGACPRVTFSMHAPGSNWGYKTDPYAPKPYHRGAGHRVRPTKTVARVPLLFPAEFSGCSVLSLATKRDDVKMVKLLLRSGAQLVQLQRPNRDPIPEFPHPSSGPSHDMLLFSHEFTT